MVVRTLLLVVMGLLTTALSAEPSESRIAIHPGMGGVTDIGVADCELFSDMHYHGPTGMEHHVLTWVQGYVYAKTGSNIDAMLDKIPDGGGWDFSSITGVFVDYCKANPEAKVAEAAIKVWDILEAGESRPE